MGRSRKNSKPLTELERLQKENQELKTEIALLEKVRALPAHNVPKDTQDNSVVQSISRNITVR